MEATAAEDAGQNRHADVSALIGIIRRLRGENGCPWDRKQTPESMWKCLAEEVYELLEAIESGDAAQVCEETGDVLFQVLFIAEIYTETGAFDLEESMARIAAKMIRRHPHVYGDASLSNEKELWDRWDRIKAAEKEAAGKNAPTSVLDGIPSGMPALMRAHKVSERAVRAGFDWSGMDQVLDKVQEELSEFKAALAGGNRDQISTEFGDVLFTLANVARLADIHPDTALARSTEKFEKRYRKMEAELAQKGLGIRDVPRQDVEQIWNRVKNSG